MRPLDTQPATPFWPAVLLATAALLTACSEPPPSSPSTGSVPTAVSAGDGTPVILISVDTLRSDRLPAYGYSAGSTPAIDALRADGVLFERAWSPVPLTLPAHVTMLTGLLPNAHGVRDNVGYTVQLDLGADLVGRLNRLGYRTGAGISAYPLSRQVGFGDGFEHFDDTTFRPELGPEGLERAGDQTLAWSQPWLSEVSAAGAPFFFFFHLYEPHAPYEPPPPFAERFDDPYDGEIAAADAIVGQLLETLRDTGVYDRALVILVSDHGEGLGAHGEEEHGLLLYREALQIPLIVKFPEGRFAGSTVERSAQLSDIAPTVLDAIGAEVPPDLDGVSLLPVIQDPEALADDRPIFAETYYPRLHLGWSELLSVVRGDDHYIQGPVPELYDLVDDPAQTANLFDDPEARRRVGEARQALRAYDPRFEPPGEATEEERAALASLGYLSGAATGNDGPLPNPKDKVHVFESLKQANSAYADGDLDKAVALYRQTVDADPTIVAAWTDLGRSLVRLGRADEAVEPFRQAALRADEPVDAARELLALLQRLGRQADALPILADALNRHPGEVRLLFVRAQVEMSLRQLDAALTTAEQALDLAPDLPDAFYLRGTIQIGRGDLAAAEVDLRRALELDGDHVASLSDLAILRARQGRLQDARDLLQRVLALRPDNKLARRHLQQIEQQIGASR